MDPSHQPITTALANPNTTTFCTDLARSSTIGHRRNSRNNSTKSKTCKVPNKSIQLLVGYHVTVILKVIK